MNQVRIVKPNTTYENSKKGGEIDIKSLTNYQRVSQYLVKIFKLVNEHYFNGELETPTITIQSSRGAYGYITTKRIWINGLEHSTYEVNIGAEYLSRSIDEVVCTVIHECCHLYNLMNNIKDVSNRGIYHNANFLKLALSKGLLVERSSRYGWSHTSPSEDTIDFCISYGLEDIQIQRKGLLPTGLGTKTTKPSSTRKYQCPKCSNSVRATKDLSIICGDCNIPFVKV